MDWLRATKLLDRYYYIRAGFSRIKESLSGCPGEKRRGNSLEDIRSSTAGGNVPKGGGPAQGIKSICSKNKVTNIIESHQHHTKFHPLNYFLNLN